MKTTITPLLLLLLAQSVVAQTFTPQTGQRWKSNSADTSIKVTCSDCAISGSVATTRTASVWLKNSKGFNLADGFTIETTFIPNANGWLFLKEGTLSMRMDSLVRFDGLYFPSDPLEGTALPQLDYYSGFSSSFNGEITIPKGRSVKVKFTWDAETATYCVYINDCLDQKRFWTNAGQNCNNKSDKAFELLRGMAGSKVTSITYKPGKPTPITTNGRSYRVTIKPDSIIFDRNDFGTLLGYAIVKGSLESRKCYPFTIQKGRSAIAIKPVSSDVGTVRIVTKIQDESFLYPTK